ncbi:ABC transporter substrate-binding protein [Candidatus Lokiarchaeum ossiferum]|uniref:ABC transporter substrate-binding protein n=1 Tax=Candidatus Lokiarchaeum ossiferum TaxID=2951803 RepID=UPI00352BF839
MKKAVKILIIMFSLLLFNFLRNNVVASEKEWKERPLNYGTPYLVKNIDPHYAWEKESIDHIDQIMEGLFAYDLRDEDLSIKPQLAKDFGVWAEIEGIGVYGNQWTYIVDLKSAIKFHDQSDFDAEDVAFSFTRLTYFCLNETATPLKKLYEPLKDLYPATPLLINKTEKIDANTVKFTLNYKFTAFEALLCFTGSVIFAQDTVPAKQYLRTDYDTLIGTGPYEQISHTEEETHFKFFEDYHGGIYNREIPRVKEMHWILYDDAINLNQAFLVGNIDAIGEISIEFMGEYQDSEFHEVENTLQGTTITYLGFNCNQTGINTRRAMQDALNYSHIFEEYPYYRLEQMTSIVPKGIRFHYDSILPIIQNITAARNHIIEAVELGEQGLLIPPNWELLKNSSDDNMWEKATIASYNYTYNMGSGLREPLGLLAKTCFAKVGIKVNLLGLTWIQFLDSIEDGTSQIFLLGWRPDYNDPNNYLYSLMSNTSIYNSVHLNDPKLQELMLQGLLEENMTKRESLYHEMQLYIKDLAPMLYLYTSNNQAVFLKGCNNSARNAMNKVYFYLWDFNYFKIPENHRISPIFWMIFGGIGIIIITFFVVHKGIEHFFEQNIERNQEKKCKSDFSN